ncbi:MAG: DUF3017 domain-containing protein [Propionibacteriaceae bacterium]
MDRRDTNAAARSLQQWPLLIVVGGVVLGLLIAALGSHTWRIGCIVIGASLLVGALERIVLPRRDAGLLQVRSQFFDVIVLALVGAAIIGLALWVHGN